MLIKSEAEDGHENNSKYMVKKFFSTLELFCFLPDAQLSLPSCLKRIIPHRYFNRGRFRNASGSMFTRFLVFWISL